MKGCRGRGACVTAPGATVPGATETAARGSSMQDRDRKVCLGAVTGAHGVRGEVRIKTFTEEPAGVAAYGPVETADGRRFAIRVTKPVKGGVAAKLAGVDTREAAEALKGQRLYVPRARLGTPTGGAGAAGGTGARAVEGPADAAGDEETYYHADLIGCVVVMEDGTEIGEVQAVHDFGAGDLLEVRREGRKSVLVPFTRAVCPKVDLDAGRIVCAPPAGLLDDAAGRKSGGRR